MKWSLFALAFSLALGAVGCTKDDSEADLEWPPNATVYFDEYGILHADCATDNDCAMVLGYYHAFDRFVQMDFLRRFATGRLTDIMEKGRAQGLAGLFVQSRALFSTRDGRPLEKVWLERSSARTVAELEAYSAGVNQWIDDVRNGRNGAMFPREFASAPFVYGPEAIPEWTPSDSLAVGLAGLGQTTNWESIEASAGAAREAIADDDRFFDLWATRPLESSILPPGWTPPPSSQKQAATGGKEPRHSTLNAGRALQRLKARLERTEEFGGFAAGAGLAGGSNNWLIAPSRTATGHALLAFDPHLAMSQPAAFYLAHLDAKTHGTGEIHVAGATVPGGPSVALGHNENIAWGTTVTFLDMSDLYVEELVKDTNGSPMGVMFKGEAVPFTRVPFEVRFNDGSTEEHELLFVPHHGPVREIDAENGVAITLRWTAQDIDTDAEVLAAMATARSVLEARTAIENVTTLGQNYAAIDTEGNIGWFPYNRIPKRTWATDLLGAAHPMLPLDGRCAAPERCYEWTEHFDLAELPQALNPNEGFIATANNDMTGHLYDGDPTNDGYAPLQTFVARGVRHARIVDRIKTIGSAHTTDTMHQIQHDTHSLLGELKRPRFIEIAESEMTTLSEAGQKILDALKAWELTCPTGLDGYYTDSPLTDDAGERLEASGCAAFHAAYTECNLTLRYRPAPVTPWMYMWTFVDPSRLRRGDVYWDDPATPEEETKYQVIEECFDEAGRLLMDHLGLGDDETKWAWGRIQALVLQSNLSGFGVSAYNNPPPGETPFANAGGRITVSPTNPELRPSGFVQQDGAVWRFVCEALPSGPSCTMEMPGGQSGHIESEHYDDLLFKYFDGEPIDLVFDIDEAKKNARRTVTFD